MEAKYGNQIQKSIFDFDHDPFQVISDHAMQSIYTLNLKFLSLVTQGEFILVYFSEHGSPYRINLASI